jgi:hypothetical protein
METLREITKVRIRHNINFSGVIGRILTAALSEQGQANLISQNLQ